MPTSKSNSVLAGGRNLANKPVNIAITPGDPAGIGPDIVIQWAQQQCEAQCVAIADPEMLLARANRLNLPLRLNRFDPSHEPQHSAAGELSIIEVKLGGSVEPGQGVVSSSAYVLESLNLATRHCLDGSLDALVTGPINKHLINQALQAEQIPLALFDAIHTIDGGNNTAPTSSKKTFSGHTEYLAELTGSDQVVMMLATHGSSSPSLQQPLRVALATTHLPLREVADAINAKMLNRTIEILHAELQQRFAIDAPRIGVCGLNPHAGEQGDLGYEEQQIINPCLDTLRARGINVSPALPADTLFTAVQLQQFDAVLAMYHDQGLPVLKSHSFGQAVNITLGLPFIRTSVDHGTAFDLAGSGKASHSSLASAVSVAIHLAEQQRLIIQ